MPPIEILKGRIDPKKLEGRVYGIIYHGAERKVSSFQEFQDQLVKILTGGEPDGFYTGKETQRQWRKRRREGIDKYGNEALIGLFPEERGHKQIRTFLQVLFRNGVETIPQLIERGERVEEMRMIGPRRIEAARLIINHFKEE